MNMHRSYCLGFSRIQRPQGHHYCWKDSQRFVVWSAGNESNESYESESILCRNQGDAICEGLTCYTFLGGRMVERMSQATGSNVVNYTSTEKLKWYLTCIYQRWEVLLERLNDHPLSQRFWCWNLVVENHSTCRDYHHYHYPNYCNLAEGSNRVVAWSCLGAVLFFPDAQCMAYLCPFTYIWVVLGVNVGKYTIHWSYID